MARYNDYEWARRGHEQDVHEEPDSEDTAGHRTHYRVVRKPRRVSCQVLGTTVQANAGDLVRVHTYFSYNTSDHPDEPNVRTGYHKVECRVACGDATPGLAGLGTWLLSKRGSYAAYHGSLPPESAEREELLSDVASFAARELDARRLPGRTLTEPTQWDFKEFSAELEGLEARTEEWVLLTRGGPADSTVCLRSLPGSAVRSWSRRLAVMEAHVETLRKREEGRLVRSSPEGSQVTWNGLLYVRGTNFTKLVAHSNLEYAGGAGDCSTHTRLHLHAPEGADYPSTTLRY